MIKLFFAIIVFLPLSVFAQVDSTSTDFPYKDGKIIYELISEISNTKQEELYSAAKKWIADSFKSGKTVIQSENATSGQIIGKGTMYVSYFKPGAFLGTAMTISLSIQIDCKDNKFRIRFYDLNKYESTGIFAGSETPLEEFDKLQTRNKKTERWGNFIKTVNSKVYSLMDGFKTSVTTSKNDTF